MPPRNSSGTGNRSRGNKIGTDSRPNTPINKTAKDKDKDTSRSQVQEDGQTGDFIASNACIGSTDRCVGNDQGSHTEGGSGSGPKDEGGPSFTSSQPNPTAEHSNQTSTREGDSTRAFNLPSRSSAKDLAVLDDFLEVMKRTFSTMSVTFDALNQQTTRIAEMGPAIDAKYQVRIANDLPSGR